MTAADQLFGDTAWMGACNFTGQHGERCRGRANALRQVLRLYARLHHTTCQWLDCETRPPWTISGWLWGYGTLM